MAQLLPDGNLRHMKGLSHLCFVFLRTFIPSSSWGDPFVRGLLVYSKIVAQEKLVHSPLRPLRSGEVSQMVKSTRRRHGGELPCQRQSSPTPSTPTNYHLLRSNLDPAIQITFFASRIRSRRSTNARSAFACRKENSEWMMQFHHQLRLSYSQPTSALRVDPRTRILC